MKYCFYIIALLLLFGCKDKLEKALVLFQAYDFSSGNYKLRFYGLENEKINDFDDFYIDNIPYLNKIKAYL